MGQVLLKNINNLRLYLAMYLRACCYYVYKSVTSSSSTSTSSTGLPKMIMGQPFPEKNKVVVITGCDTGFGRLLSEQLAAHSVSKGRITVVSLCYTAKAVKELTKLGAASTTRTGHDGIDTIRAIQCDITKDDDVERAAKDIADLLDEKKAVLHTLVNNAGIVNAGNFLFYSDIEPFKSVMDVNFYGMLRVTQALLPLFLRTSFVYGGRIVNISSVCGCFAVSGNSTYNASKFAVEGWSDSLRLELAERPFNIKVVKVRPGSFGTLIHSEWRKGFESSYQNTSRQVRDLYGGKAFEKQIKKRFESSSTLADPQEMVDFLKSTILEKNQNKLQPSYWVGSDGHTSWKARYHLPTKVADAYIKIFLPFTPKQKDVPLPPSNIISHVTIRVTDLKRSVLFYEAFGFKSIGNVVDRQQFLSLNPSKSNWSTLVLLKEDPTMSPRGDLHDAGMTRLSIYTTSLHKDIQHLQTLGLKPIAPTACDKSRGFILQAHVTAYKDPDGFVVYLVEFSRLMGILTKLSLWQKKKQTPCLFHWTINVTESIENVMKAFECLGFATHTDLNSHQVLNDLLPAFQFDPDTTKNTTKIERIRMSHLPKDDFCVTLMQWVNPKTEKRGSELTNALTIAVDDVDAALEIAKRAGLVVKEPAEYRHLPVFGGVMVGTAYVESGSSPIELCCFSHKR